MEVDAALKSVDRRDFLPEDVVELADHDNPLPIGYGQTNSQPYTVRLMLKWLDAKPGQKVLDVGSGSGWTAALLSQLVGPEGFVYGVELVPELVEFGRRNLKNSGVGNARIHQAAQGYGLPAHAPYDRILVSAAATKLPYELIVQLKDPGKMVIPVKNDVLQVSKIKNNLDIKWHPGFAFVPLKT